MYFLVSVRLIKMEESKDSSKTNNESDNMSFDERYYNEVYNKLMVKNKLSSNDVNDVDFSLLGFKSGVEIHQQLDTHKLFCECKSDSPTFSNDDKEKWLKIVREKISRNRSYSLTKSTKERVSNSFDYDYFELNDFNNSNEVMDYINNSAGSNLNRVIKRNLNVSEGETGEIDLAAKYELKKKKDFFYDTTNVCLVELDEEPPHEVNREALYTALQIVDLLKAKRVDRVSFMRKIVVDGSNTSGFQRTGLIATDGVIDIKRKNDVNAVGKENEKVNKKISNEKVQSDTKETSKIRIDTICLEEDAAQIIDRTNNYDIYSLERLGIPLVEIATAPDIHNPNDVKNTVETIGLLLRSVKVKRGIGTIRQDVNISIKNGNRIEIKGAQDLSLLNKIAKREAMRQLRFLQVKEKINDLVKKNREIKDIFQRASYKDLEGRIVDVTSVFKETKSKLIINSLESNKKTNLKEGKDRIIHNEKRVYAMAFPGLKGLFGFEILPEMRLGKDLYHYVSLIVPIRGIIHSDELPNYGISDSEVSSIYKMLKITREEDAFVFVITDFRNSLISFSRIIERLNSIKELGVPTEVRKALKDGNTSYLRPMPGAARMYPETDVPPIDLSNIIVELPETIEDRIKKLIGLGIEKDISKVIVKKGLDKVIIKFTGKYSNLKPSFIAMLVYSKINELKRTSINMSSKSNQCSFDEKNIDSDFIDTILELISKLKISKQSVDEILWKKGCGEKVIFKDYYLVDKKVLIKKVKEVLNKNPNIPRGALIGIIMKEFNGKVDGRKLNELITTEIKNRDKK